MIFSNTTNVDTGPGTHDGPPPFGEILLEKGIPLRRGKTTTLQINTGLLCNQECRHCHQSAGPERHEVMDAETMAQVVEFAGKCQFETADITGGAPEMNPGIIDLVNSLSGKVPRLMLRSNLTAASGDKWENLTRTLRKNNVIIVASLPSLNRNQTDSQRGGSVFDKSIKALKRLNEIGYGVDGSGFELNLVSNPTGAFLGSPQGMVEKRYRQTLKRRYNIEFNSLFAFSNVPLGRFRNWLITSGNYDDYIRKLADSFNPYSVEGLMCRSMVSVSWDGHLFDCDFNLATKLPIGLTKTHVSEMEGPPEQGAPIAISDHCYSCTAGAGFSCGGAITS